MVTFEKWLLKSLKNNCGFLKIEREGVIYSVPYDASKGEFYDAEIGNISLKNLVTERVDTFPLKEVFNVEIFSMGNYEESLKSTYRVIRDRILPMLSEKFINLTEGEVSRFIFIDDMNVNYMRILDFMGYHNPKDFCRVNFNRFRTIHSIPNETLCGIYSDFSLVVNKKMEMVIEDLNKNLGEDSVPIVEDIRTNVSDFLEKIRDIPPGKLQDHWPTLINPSPYYFQPRVSLKDG